MRTVALAGKGDWGHPCRQRRTLRQRWSHPSGAQGRRRAPTPDGPGERARTVRLAFRL